ncbi:MAG: UDP-glucose dehydrogenase [Candidatus Giovannonibacteria bacterium GW2011_GWB1_46_20]|uniref:UDP-glucose dehydrogenase n=1 Tax=Candidatus Giovannonibacteria bacterium GW2011_GWA1_44_25 TaxID=1618645 RepID=A0A0G1ILS6_9BACT|nr:MAG: UDP-glucose 6-dehydrogenase [Parcubacteria group bacterium GW2011_GWC1_44_10]KKT60371.1 MAG: UDP-glucose dehydrogenase [Candidatus Giovannonibacteria bacterium GW2011_GWA1_44_25]KKU30229.1 MAG: UDP-glucose dehydrogenase [Candidatus Giovannonibacteria bacterium GW2011_GWB1_46_20]
MCNMDNKPKIGILGVGMVGKEAARYFLESGWERGKSLFLHDTDAKKNFSDDIKKANIIFICVPTPSKKDGSCDTSIVESVINKYHAPDRILVIKSTVEPGTVARFQKKYKSPILFNPEFLTESRAWEDFIRPDKQIVGHTHKSQAVAGSVLNLLPQAYFSAPGTLGTYEFVRVNSSEAEFGKYASNVFGALKVTYANVLADFANALEKVQRREGIKLPVDYENIRKMVAHDRRIGDAWMNVYHGNYRGFGGYCFPKDFKAFMIFGNKLIKKLNKKKDKNLQFLLKSGLGFLEAVWKYNSNLLKSQDLSVELVSSHESNVRALLEKKWRRNNKKNQK